MAAFIIPPLPPNLVGFPAGVYGISYDIFTRATEDVPGAGWGAHRANTYHQLIQRLQAAGYNHLQYSNYSNPAATAVATWTAMLGLLNIQPPGIFESTVRGLHMYRLDPTQVMDVTPSVKLGGIFCPGQRGPTPYGLTLVPPAVGPLVPVPGIPAAMPVLPLHTRATLAAGNPVNWRF